MNISESEMFPESVFTEGGIHVDFVSGVRIGIPAKTPSFLFKITDADTGEEYDTGVLEGKPDEKTYLYTKRKYFSRWRVELYRGGKWFFNHVFDARGKTVFIDLSFGALGDTAAWLPAAVRFFQKWECRGIVCMRPEHIELYQECYPEIKFVPPSEETTELAIRCYARYGVAVYGYGQNDYEVIDFRENNLIRHAEMILGMDADNRPPKISEGKGEIPPELAGKPYVCIATRASRYCKEWHYKDGWKILCDRLKARGFIPVCIDGDNINMPETGTLDDTGMKPLPYRLKVIRGASFFIGLPSGLSWIAWACGKPVVLISGFTDSYVEFDTPYRVSPPPGVCHGCWGTCDHRKERFETCFHDIGNECTTSITPDMVMAACERVIDDYGIKGAGNSINEQFRLLGDKKPCPICSRATARFSAVKWDRKSTAAQESRWKYYHCDHCGSYFLDEMRGWSPEMFAEKVYNAEYSKTDVEFDGTRSKKLLPKIAGILKMCSGSRILDYGGGSGSLVDLLRKDGFDAYCYDPFGRQDVSGDARGFDFIVAIEVLEHIIEARSLWETISGKLNPGGIFIATTSTVNGRSVAKWDYANPRAGHCMLYSAAALYFISKQHGLQPVGGEGNLYVFRKQA